MSEQVQVREGVWLTRDGAHVEVRANDSANAAEFPWRGMLCGVSEIWHDDGRWRISGGDHYRDLVQYVGPLPEPEPLPQQTTTDTLAEIEEQAGETLQEALGRALEQAYIADLKNAIDAVTADRDRLQQAHQTMTKHSAELLESAQQARESRDSLEQQLRTMTYERDILAQRLVTKPSEEALQKQVSRQQIEINTLEDRLADTTITRDQSASAVLRVTADRDGLRQTVTQLRQQLETMTSERDEVANELRAMTDHCSRQQEQLQALTEKREQLTVLLSNAQCAHDMMQGQVQRLQAELTAANELLQNERLEAQQAHAGRKRAEEHLEEVTAEVQRLTAELRQAQIDLDAEGETPASNCRAIAEGHLIGAQSGRQAAFEAVERWLEPLAAVDSEHAAAVLQALPSCIRKLAELEGVTW